MNNNYGSFDNLFKQQQTPQLGNSVFGAGNQQTQPSFSLGPEFDYGSNNTTPTQSTTPSAAPKTSGDQKPDNSLAQGVNAFSGLVNAYTGFEQLALGKKQFDVAKNSFNINNRNFTTDYNAKARGRARADSAAYGRTVDPTLLDYTQV